MRRSRPNPCPEGVLCGASFVAPLVASAVLLALGACGAPSATSGPPAASLGVGPRLRFEYVTIDGLALSSETLAGRFSVIAFLATYDLASQAQARFLSSILRSHKPRINVAALALEQPENKPLVQAFVGVLHLTYPVALADAATIAGEGPFAGLHHVPSLVVLDREGREVWRHIGITNEATLEDALKHIERGEAPDAQR